MGPMDYFDLLPPRLRRLIRESNHGCALADLEPIWWSVQQVGEERTIARWLELIPQDRVIVERIRRERCP